MSIQFKAHALGARKRALRPETQVSPRTIGPSFRETAAGPGFRFHSPAQPCAHLSKAHLYPYVLTLCLGRCWCPGLGLPMVVLLLAAAVGQALASSPCPDTIGSPRSHQGLYHLDGALLTSLAFMLSPAEVSMQYKDISSCFGVLCIAESRKWIFLSTNSHPTYI